jgi:hypothetical protein
MQSDRTQDLTDELAEWEAASDEDWLVLEAELMEIDHGLTQCVLKSSHADVRARHLGMPDSTNQ